MTDETTPQNSAAMPPASAGSVASAGTLRDTFAAAALTGLLSSLPNGDQYYSFAVEHAWSLADAMLRERERRRCPVSAQQNLTLTDAEREAVEWFSHFGRPQNGPVIGKHAAALRGLLERLK